MGRDEVQCFAKIDHKMIGEHRHIFEPTVDLNLQPGGCRIEDRDKAVISVGVQSQIWIAGVVVDEIQKCGALPRGIAALSIVPQWLRDAGLTKHFTKDGNANPVELATKLSYFCRIVLLPVMAAQR